MVMTQHRGSLNGFVPIGDFPIAGYSARRNNQKAVQQTQASFPERTQHSSLQYKMHTNLPHLPTKDSNRKLLVANHPQVQGLAALRHRTVLPSTYWR